jgi:hypothetical protein
MDQLVLEIQLVYCTLPDTNFLGCRASVILLVLWLEESIDLILLLFAPFPDPSFFLQMMSCKKNGFLPEIIIPRDFNLFD